MFDRVWDVLIQCAYPKSAARLYGYRRVCVKEEDYPGLVEFKGAYVDGVLVSGIMPPDIIVLDRFEGEYYCRKKVQVVSTNGEEIDAETYVFREEFRGFLTNTEWSVDKFRRHGIDRFIGKYAGFKSVRTR
jgi:hypothetical protein